MNIEEVRLLKLKLEGRISDEVAAFHNKTGARVTEIGLIRHEAKFVDGRPATVVYEISVTAEV